ncbi:hypothetical protein KZ810_02705 [Sphingomonas sp. RHCKR47]|nr:hypothetical protein [Sphingomonas citricola]
MTVTSEIAVFAKADGALQYLAAKSAAPKSGDPKLGSVSLPAGYDAALWEWSTAKRQMLESAAQVQAMLIDQINAEREVRQMTAMTAGGAKKAVYAMQQAEVLAWSGLGAAGATTTQLIAAFNLLPLTARKQKFYFAMMSAEKRGETSIALAIARFSAGAASSNYEVARVEAIARAGIDAVKAATTASAKRAAAAGVDWSWKPA